MTPEQRSYVSDLQEEIERLRKENAELEAEVRRLMIIAKNEINTIREERDELLAALEIVHSAIEYENDYLEKITREAIASVKGATP